MSVLRTQFVNSINSFICERLGKFSLRTIGKSRILNRIETTIDTVGQVSSGEMDYFTSTIIHRIIKEFIILDDNYDYDYDDGIFSDLISDGRDYFSSLSS
jgi:hypothetical protein